MNCFECGASLALPRKVYCSRKCHNRAKARRWRAKNPERSKELDKRSRTKHRDARCARLRKWHHANKDQQNAKRRRWHHSNREYANEQRRQRRANHIEEENLRQREYNQRTRIALPWKALLKSAEERARKKNLPYSLTSEWAEEKWTGRCSITNIPFRIGLRVSGPKMLSPSIDRIVPSFGYVPDNCRFVIWAVNAFKYDGNDDDMVMIARAIVEYADRKV